MLAWAILHRTAGQADWRAKCRDAEEADIEKERKEQAKGPAARAHELEELTAIYEDRGLSHGLARQVRAHAARSTAAHLTQLFCQRQPAYADAVCIVCTHYGCLPFQSCKS